MASHRRQDVTGYPVTTGYAAKRLGITRARVRQLCNARAIPFTLVRGVYRHDRIFEWADIERLAAQKAARPTRSKWWAA